MKIIDLLNKIAKGEDVPKKITLDNYVFEFNKTYEQYHNKYETNLLEHISDYNYSGLNDEIEIIEEVEDKEYEDIEELSYVGYTSNTHEVDKELYYIRTINALIRNQKKILERLDNDK